MAFFFGLTRIFRADPGAESGDIRLHLEDPIFSLLLALRLRVAVNIPGALPAIGQMGSICPPKKYRV